ncbi:MAG: hypothetical protein R8G33_01525 [Gammaproteobacteria bacterium]|nr:hypothetical protein [Gammaproteobacteria bacterium]
MKSKIGEIHNLYAFFNLSHPELIRAYQNHITNQDIVAAKLVASSHVNNASTKITTIDNIDYIFPLDLTSRNHQSKGNWIWVTQIDILFPEKLLISVPINAQIFDIPYSHNKVCAHWLVRNVASEIKEILNSHL